MTTEERTFVYGEGFHEHTRGDEACEGCWKSSPCRCECGGLVHGQFFEEDWDSVFLAYYCDRCGEDYQEA